MSYSGPNQDSDLEANINNSYMDVEVSEVEPEKLGLISPASQPATPTSNLLYNNSKLASNLDRKSVNGFKTGYSVNDKIESGNTNYYKATIKYPPMSKGEFFIEAFSSQGGYGHLDPWYSSNWNYKREITINASQIATTTSNFPVLATTTMDDLKTTTNGGKVGNDNGHDIIFVDDDDSTLLNFEREKYASTTGEIVYWINTDISSTTDKTIYMYYGNGSAADQATTTGVWDDNFVMVQHLQETPDNTAGQIKDSTSNANDGQTFTMASDDQVAGQIDGSLNFDGGSDYVNAGNEASVQLVSGTVEAWIKTSSAGSSYRGIVTKQHAYGMFLVDNVFGVHDWSASSFRTSGINLADGNWHHAVFSFQSGVANGTKFYIDGVWKLNTTITISNQTVGIAIAAGTTGATQNFNGLIDEVRISSIARTAGWIETEYNNQVSVDSFMTIGAEMSVDWYSTNWKYRRQIDINSLQIATTTSDFPILATTTLDDLKTIANSGKVESENGYDIIFVDFSGNILLNFEKEKYSSTTGEIVYWIKTDISSTLDKAIFMYYGNDSATDQSTTTGVWDDNYKGVWHLAETDIDNGAGDIKDSTINAKNGTTYNMNTDDQITGQINGSFDFNGTDNHINIGNAYDGVKTISFWLKPDDAIDRMILDIDGTDYIKINANSKIEPINFTSPIIYVDGTIASSTDTNWHYAVITDTTGVNASAINISKVATSYFDGIIDEVRISNIVRHAGWIETEYNNQSDASDFLTINAEESLKLVITTSAKTLVAGTESTAFTVQIQDLSSNPINMGSNTTINLSSDSSLYFFASTTGGTEISSVTIPSGSNSVNFYYTDHKAGSPTITVTATNLVLDTQQQTILQACDSWYNASYQYRRKIILEADQIATTTDVFPVLVNDTLTYMKTATHSGNVENDSGYDIVFTDDDGTALLNFEREKYASTTGEIVYWIKTDISSTTDKTIYMYYGNGSATDQATTTGVWDDNFVMVQHLSETPDNTADQIKDSTSNVNDGQTATMASDDQVAGQIDGSLDFDGGGDYVDCGTSLININSDFSLSAWININDIIHNSYVVMAASINGSVDNSHWILIHRADRGGIIWQYDLGAGDAGFTTPSIDLTPNLQQYVVLVRDQTNGNLKIYLDNVIITDEDINPTFGQSTGHEFPIGAWSVASPGNFFNGIIDEVRVSNIARTAGWIETEYNNQSDTDSFMTIFGVEEGILTISTDPKVITAGTESTAFTVQANHNVAADTTVNLSSNSSGAYHFAASPGGAEVSSVTIPSGTNSVDFYYTDNEAGSPTIVVAATNFVSDDQQQTVVKIITQLNSPHTDKWADGLVGYWSFDGQDMDWSSSAAEAIDRSGQGNYGDVINGAKAVIGKVGQGLEFDGSGDYVDVGSVYNGVKTVNFWIKASNLTKKIIDLNGTADIEVVSGTITANNFSNTVYVDGVVSSVIDTDWHHVAIATGTAINVNAFDIGRISADYFNGIIDEVRVYNRTLSAGEIAEQYRVGARKFQIDSSKGYKTIIE